MDEKRWLLSEDPAVMILHLTHDGYVEFEGGVRGTTVRATPLVSPRKLRLFACAALRLRTAAVRPGFGRAVSAAEAHADGLIGDTALAAAGAVGWDRPGDYWACCDPEATRGAMLSSPGTPAELLREIAGNPFRPVTLPKVRRRCESCNGKGSWSVYKGPGATNLGFVGCKRCDELGWFEDAACHWITPTVVALAQSAYDERTRECRRCKGRKYISRRVSDDGVGRSTIVEDCPDCHSTGTIDDGKLDPLTLAVLSDALEEAGCDDEAILNHLRGRVVHCVVDGQATCLDPSCDGWRTLPGPHYRGCHVIDHILGRK